MSAVISAQPPFLRSTENLQIAPTWLTPTLLRRYSRFIYRHIHRYDYGYRRPGEGIIRIPKNKLIAARNAKSYRSLTKLTESHLKRHLNKQSTYYYTGQRRKPHLLLCVDIDAHQGQEDAWDIAHYLRFWWFKNSYLEPSTSGSGVHLYFVLDLAEYPRISTRTLRRLFGELEQMLQLQVKAEGYDAEVCGIYGLPSDWANDVQAQMIKLPRPRSMTQLNELVGLTYVSLDELKVLVKENGREVEALCPSSDRRKSKDEASFESAGGSIKGAGEASVGSINAPQTDCAAGQPSPSSSFSSCTMIVTDKVTEHSSTCINSEDITRVKNLDLDDIRAKNPLYRSSWTVKTLANILGRSPTVREALNFYAELQIGTGEETQQRVRRFTQVVEYNRKHFDPSRRRSFSKMYPALRIMIERAVAMHSDVALTFQSRKDRRASNISLESLCVGYYFSLFQLGGSKDGSLPIDGMVGLNRKLADEKVVNGSISRQKASAIRRVLAELGLLVLVDEKYRFGAHGVAKKYRLGQAA